jgi:hypothetical protein
VVKKKKYQYGVHYMPSAVKYYIISNTILYNIYIISNTHNNLVKQQLSYLRRGSWKLERLNNCPVLQLHLELEYNFLFTFFYLLALGIREVC